MTAARRGSRSERNSPASCPRRTIRSSASNASPISATRSCTCGLRATSRTSTRTRSGSRRHEQVAPVLAEDGLEQLLLRGEVVVEKPVRDARLLGDVPDPARVVALPREDTDGGIEQQPALLLLGD